MTAENVQPSVGGMAGAGTGTEESVPRVSSVPPGSLAEAMLREAADFRTAVEDLAGDYTALGDALIFASGVASRLFDVLNPK